MKGFSVGLHQHGNRSHSPCTDHNQSDKSNFEILFYSFIPMVYGMENGKFFVWYTILSAWGTDIFAYAVGRRIGKHKFSQISGR